jgi:hypothetical protein
MVAMPATKAVNALLRTLVRLVLLPDGDPAFEGIAVPVFSFIISFFRPFVDFLRIGGGNAPGVAGAVPLGIAGGCG